MPSRHILEILLPMLLLGGCGLLQPRLESPLIGLAGIQPQDTTLFEQRYQLQLRVQNPNDVDLSVKGVRCTLYINEREVARGVSPAAVTIPRFGEALLAVNVVSDLRRVFEELRDGVRDSGMPVSYRIGGKLSLEGHAFPLPFDYSGEFDLRGLR